MQIQGFGRAGYLLFKTKSDAEQFATVTDSREFGARSIYCLRPMAVEKTECLDAVFLQGAGMTLRVTRVRLSIWSRYLEG